MRLLFVCTGNICRSPVAERLLDAGLRSLGLPDLVEVRSAGTQAAVGRAIHPASAEALIALGGDAGDFAARQLTADEVASADLVLTMTRSHRRAVLALDPRGLRRTFTLIEAADLTRIADLAPVRSSTAEDRGKVLVAQLAAARARRHGTDADDVPDPINQPAAVHRSVADRIAAHVGVLTDALVPYGSQMRPHVDLLR